MYSKVILVGFLGRDPEMRYTPQGNPVTNFSVATNRKRSGETETTWFNVSVWGNSAEVCNKYLRKGSKVMVEGRLSPDDSGGPRVWYDKKNEEHRASYDVSATDVQFLSGKEE